MIDLRDVRFTRSRCRVAPVAMVLESRLLLTAGQPDPTFHGGLPLTVPLTFEDYQTFGVIRNFTLNDGKILMVSTGIRPPAPVNYTTPLLIRLNPDGSYDTTYGQGGYLPVAGPGYVEGFSVANVALQSDGKLLLLGFAAALGQETRVLQRLMPDGSPDTTFGQGGSIALDSTVISGVPTTYFNPVVSPAGKIVLQTYNSNTSSEGLLRLNSDGSIDTSFGADGDGLFRYGNNVAFTGLTFVGESIVIGEFPVPSPAPGHHSGLIRVTPGGVLDTTFGDQGLVEFPIEVYTTGLLTDESGRVIAYTSTAGIPNPLILMRFLPDGSLDPSFGPEGSQGINRLPVMASKDANGRTLQVMFDDGRSLLVGLINSTDGTDTLRYVLSLLDANGLVDTSYGQGGIAVVDLPFLAFYDMTLDTQGNFRALSFGSDENRFNWFTIIHEFDTFDRPPDPPTPPEPPTPPPPEPPTPPPTPDTTPPRVRKILAQFSHHRLVRLKVRFSEAMNVRRAASRASYRLVTAGHDGRFGTGDDRTIALASVRYRVATRQAIIRLAEPVKSHKPLAFLIRGNRLTDLAGVRLAGRRGVPGTNHRSLIVEGR